jgi:hypothetical protein
MFDCKLTALMVIETKVLYAPRRFLLAETVAIGKVYELQVFCLIESVSLLHKPAYRLHDQSDRSGISQFYGTQEDVSLLE